MNATDRFLRSLLRVCETVAVVRRGVSLVGTATSNRPFGSSLTGRGAGAIAILPFSQRTSSGIPGFIPDSRRISLGITNLPAWSMVVFMVRKYHFSNRLPIQNRSGESRGWNIGVGLTYQTIFQPTVPPRYSNHSRLMCGWSVYSNSLFYSSSASSNFNLEP